MSSGFARHCFEEAYKAGWNACVEQMLQYQVAAAEYSTDIFAEIYDGPAEPEEDGYDQEDIDEAWLEFCQEEWG